MKERGLAALVLAGLVACLFRDVLFRHALYYRDIHLGGYGQVDTFARCIAAGSWPVWDPYLGFGRPLLANPAAQAPYPWTWLSLLFTPWVSYTLAPVLRANVAFRAVSVTAGRHEVELLYRPSVEIGLGVSAATLLGLAGGVFLWARRRGPPAAA